MYLVGAGYNAPECEFGSPACIDPLQPLLTDNKRPRPGLPRRLGHAISANILQCAAHCILPSCKPTNVSNWSVYRSESSAYKRHPACPYDARLVQLSINACAGLDAGAFSAPHQSDDDEGKPACDIQSSASTARHPALVVPIQEQGRNMPCRFSPVDGSALRDSSTACTVRSASTPAAHTSRSWAKGATALAARPIHAKKHVLRDGQLVLAQKSADFWCYPVDELADAQLALRIDFWLRLVTCARFFECVDLCEDARN
ncbi:MULTISPECIES: hypothetical protein [Burkholderia]|jgi:hypothetical protein|uniref:Uncharacterized protein n=2 Tax=Burkholderia contaminans TaxID=488447 RepID=A0A250L847_9BURK|nr:MULTISPECIES: hypothetical protein [Burkholderia]UTP21907.1 hypothetical protein NMB33_16230 [Burkholderia sp. FXe9]MBH9694420.1 hypothetical protein [Burkholderia contaminans]MBK1905808.1 hypothetical protein [Burkholderia contaminans]MBK1913814.1 hypothetical protein [Burkholderia contaminans]MBK1928225.1 hypothetical protein [Burkholderia contaminans]